MSDVLVQITGVHKAFGNTKALDGMDMTIPKGKIFGVVGPNGAGKTTLFSVMCGFLGADSGSVTIGGQDIRPSRPPKAGLVAILPQDARFIGGVKILSQMAYYARLSGFSKREAKKEAERVLALVKLSEKRKKAPEQLSHGMRKRVGIAQAFVGKPMLTILDEPTAGLDPHAARDIRALIRGCMDGERTVIVSSHNLLEIEDLCQEVAIIHEGRLVRQDRVTAVVGDAAEIAFKMAQPPEQKILDALTNLDFVTGVVWDNDVARLRIAFDATRTPPEAASRDLVGFLVEKQIAFLDMQLGKTLEDRFVEETR